MIAAIVASMIVCMSARQFIPEYGPLARKTRGPFVALRQVDARVVETAQSFAVIHLAHALRFFDSVHEKADQTINAISGHCELSCSVVSFSDNLTYKPIRSACQLFFDMVLAKIVMDCQGDGLSQRPENAGL